ncbi:hypothetical protein [Roseinatronobacter sp.]|uniref:hypothetical protein n=1 Tax=Roseinatronobacter sp. TaxID=1945755 RepID=UPI0025F82593|nr:hypothetical protein [Roseibaca sp.]
MSSKPTSQTTPTKRRRTRAEREEHAEFVRRSVARKKAQGLFRANLWIPKDQNAYFQSLAAEARAQHLERTEQKSAQVTSAAAKPARRRKATSDPRQGKLPL